MMLLHCKTLYWKVVKWQQVNGTNQILGLQEKQEDHALELFGEAGVVFFQLKYFYWHYGSEKLSNVHNNYLLIGRHFNIMFIPWTGLKFVTTKISCALNAQSRLLSPLLGLVYHRHVCFHIFWGKPFDSGFRMLQVKDSTFVFTFILIQYIYHKLWHWDNFVHETYIDDNHDFMATYL